MFSWFLSVSMNTTISAQKPAVLSGSFRVFSHFLPAYLNTSGGYLAPGHVLDDISIRGWGRRLLCSSYRPDRLFGPPFLPISSCRGLLLGMERPECEADHTCRSSAITPCVFFTRCLIKLRNSGTLISAPTFWQMPV